jgi:hypothetical protein
MTDMWPAYLKVLRERALRTTNILDRFHIMKKFSEALDKVRADETRQLLRDGYESVLTKSRWCILKKRENLTETQTVRLNELLKYNLFPSMGIEVPARLVHKGESIRDRTYEENGQDARTSRAIATELVRSPRVFFGNR